MTLQNIIHKDINDLLAPAFNNAFESSLKITDFDFVSVRTNTEVMPTKDTKGIIRILDASKAYTSQREVSYNRQDAMELGYLAKSYGLELNFNHIEEVMLARVTWKSSSRTRRRSSKT